MESNYRQTYIEKGIDDIIVKILFPITNQLLSKTQEIKRKRQELRNEINNMKQLKQSIIERRKKLNKQKIQFETNMNGDFSNVKTCRECLINYINLLDKKENDFLKDREDYYEIKLRRKKLEFNNMLMDLITEEKNKEQKPKKKLKRKMSFEPPKKLNQSSHSIPKNLNKSYRSDTSETKQNANKTSTVTPKKMERSKKNSYKAANKPNKENKNLKNSKKNSNKNSNKNLKRKKTNESNVSKKNNNKENKEEKEKEKEGGDAPDVSKDIEKLINDYGTKNSMKSHNSLNSETLNEGLNKLKEINKDTKNIENNLKEMMDYINNDNKETEPNS